VRLDKAATVAQALTRGVACCFFMLDDQDTRRSVPYIMPLPLKVNDGVVSSSQRENRSTRKKVGVKKKAGGALPQAPP
jgi:hypothetical protein